jgi:hypothetical protein
MVKQCTCYFLRDVVLNRIDRGRPVMKVYCQECVCERFCVVTFKHDLLYLVWLELIFINSFQFANGLLFRSEET